MPLCRVRAYKQRHQAIKSLNLHKMLQLFPLQITVKVLSLFFLAKESPTKLAATTILALTVSVGIQLWKLSSVTGRWLHKLVKTTLDTFGFASEPSSRNNYCQQKEKIAIRMDPVLGHITSSVFFDWQIVGRGEGRFEPQT